ncbi:hypothetical protein JCM30471_07280 [Desulfuromonas carbonis]|uniref:double zinc ribbon domain-containing protein n=1 Tax=Desulfuromonas sp. DDH964 TaxID=1823759 RepID=UPI00078DCB78|nr:zinc ribbon domain-containing protein [Desulfuromonas sp. DDH964]AMV72243.1 hypothetical protein DBW_1890 [Desulfuromonas sp. DDH964]
MLLIFLLIFALLALAIVQQIERRPAKAEPPYGNCPGCGGRAEVDWLICPRCKELLQCQCPGCGERLPVFHRFCTACGTSRKGSFGADPP